MAAKKKDGDDKPARKKAPKKPTVPTGTGGRGPSRPTTVHAPPRWR